MEIITVFPLYDLAVVLCYVHDIFITYLQLIYNTHSIICYVYDKSDLQHQFCFNFSLASLDSYVRDGDAERWRANNDCTVSHAISGLRSGLDSCNSCGGHDSHPLVYHHSNISHLEEVHQKGIHKGFLLSTIFCSTCKSVFPLTVSPSLSSLSLHFFLPRSSFLPSSPFLSSPPLPPFPLLLLSSCFSPPLPPSPPFPLLSLSSPHPLLPFPSLSALPLPTLYLPSTQHIFSIKLCELCGSRSLLLLCLTP